MSRQNISSNSIFESQISYSRAVVSGSWVFVSGTTGYDYATNTVQSSIIEQTEQALKNIQGSLKEAGANMNDVVRVRYIVPDAKEFPQTWPILKRYFGDVRPAATMLQAKLMSEEMRIEIEVTARKEKGKEGGGRARL